MFELNAVNLQRLVEATGGSGRRVKVLWQDSESLAFVARGREYRSEFHVDPSDETMLMVRGDMDLHYRTPEGERRVTVIREGEIIHCPAGTPHSPRFAPDAWVLVLERKRRPDEQDRFLWFCDRCDAKVYEAVFSVRDYREDPVSRVYEQFYASEANRTCARCGYMVPRPPG
ncbi:MAG: 3-hydroxybutyryl-CoA dehydratase [Deltaproteobacteria bacterium]|nr:3-hydroxybutyryl-CoA dehydratase [Deltaproteobacteria bacterium]MBI3075679.1 3-hydroxybutyryl-CoA dehydratase [Deltaproteobacteria bacterium]